MHYLYNIISEKGQNLAKASKRPEHSANGERANSHHVLHQSILSFSDLACRVSSPVTNRRFSRTTELTECTLSSMTTVCRDYKVRKGVEEVKSTTLVLLLLEERIYGAMAGIEHV
jgi:hypothetical protein